MPSASSRALRELDHRSYDGIDVRLLWLPDTNRVAIAVEDERSGELLPFDVDSADALDAFHHPYAYAEVRHTSRLTQRSRPQERTP